MPRRSRKPKVLRNGDFDILLTPGHCVKGSSVHHITSSLTNNHAAWIYSYRTWREIGIHVLTDGKREISLSFEKLEQEHDWVWRGLCFDNFRLRFYRDGHEQSVFEAAKQAMAHKPWLQKHQEAEHAAHLESLRGRAQMAEDLWSIKAQATSKPSPSKPGQTPSKPTSSQP
jgi:hypothetical protein